MKSTILQESAKQHVKYQLSLNLSEFVLAEKGAADRNLVKEAEMLQRFSEEMRTSCARMRSVTPAKTLALLTSDPGKR
jgi:hypothetical protein